MGPVSIEGFYDEAFAVPGMLGCIRDADRDGADAHIIACFDDALSFIRSAVEAVSSKACYLHGSFGSGKSHYMAVLHLLLQHNPAVRSIRW